MVDREELAVRKGVEARAHTVGAEREKPNRAPQRVPPRCPVLVRGPLTLGEGGVSKTPPTKGTP